MCSLSRERLLINFTNGKLIVYDKEFNIEHIANKCIDDIQSMTVCPFEDTVFYTRYDKGIDSGSNSIWCILYKTTTYFDTKSLLYAKPLIGKDS